MDTQTKIRILTGLSFAQVSAHDSSNRFGYWEKRRSPEELAGLLHRDVSKILEITIAGNGRSPHLEDCSTLEEAMADVIIRILDISGGDGLHVGAAVLAKLEYNEKLSHICKKDY